MILEQHSHCEVPAGCGGVVLRWRSDLPGVPVLVHSCASGKSKLFIDGQSPTSSQSLIPFGDHVLSLVLEELPKNAILAVAVVHDASRVLPVSQQVGELLNVLSDADGTWKRTTVKLADDQWMKSGFDDSSWATLEAAEPPALEQRKAYTPGNIWELNLQMALDRGAKCLRVNAPRGQMWVRRAFRIAKQGGNS